VSGCSATCGQGRRIRERKRLQAAQHGGQECTGRSYELDGECNTGCCPQNCEWSAWTWSACSATCGQGTMRGQRTVARSACGGGRECSPADGETVVPCNGPSCQLPLCQWAPWSSWSDELIIIETIRSGNASGRARIRSAGQTGGPECVDTRTETEEQPEAADPGMQEPVVVVRSAALWVTPLILGLILLLLLLLLIIWLVCHCRRTKDKSLGKVILSSWCPWFLSTVQ
jgi:hypothetical protein